MDSIGERIRYARKINKLTLTDVKEMTGLSTGNLSELENNKFLPSTNALLALKKVFNVSVDWILTGEGSMEIKDCFQEVFPHEKEDPICLKENTPTYHLNNDEKKLIEGYRNLEQETQRDLLGFIEISLKIKDFSNKRNSTSATMQDNQ